MVPATVAIVAPFSRLNWSLVLLLRVLKALLVVVSEVPAIRACGPRKEKKSESISVILPLANSTRAFPSTITSAYRAVGAASAVMSKVA